jgi:glycyl-tRNA synthetase beta chain
MFWIQNYPSGDKDPFALRRHAIGALRLIIDLKLGSGYFEDVSFKGFVFQVMRRFREKSISGSVDESQRFYDFLIERLRVSLREQNYSAFEVDAVLALADGRTRDPFRLADVIPRIEAVRAFAALPEAPALAAANKRVGNILKKADGEVLAQVNPALLQEAAEQALAAALAQVAPQADAAFVAGDYTASLQALAALRTPVDAFFDDVMVNAEDPALKANRLGLLKTLHEAMNRVADLGRLAA